jgi:glycosyltransferase involved in cell wall biosynthesis
MHEYIYETLLKYPGITVLHDYVLHPFIQNITFGCGNQEDYASELIGAYGNDGRRIAESYRNGVYCPIDYMKYPLNERVVEASTKIVVHSKYVRSLLKNNDKVWQILPGRYLVELAETEIAQNKRDLGFEGHWPVIGCFGFISYNRRIDVLTEAFSRVAQDYPEAILLLVGDIDGQLKKQISSMINELGIKSKVVFTGYKDNDEYYKYVSCMDIVVNLRYPTMGENSGTLLDALALGKPVIVSNIGSYREIPANCCWKVDVDSTEHELLLAYLKEIISNEPLRKVMCINAKSYISINHRWDLVSLDYIKLILTNHSDRKVNKVHE